VTSAIGVAAGATVPASWELEFGLPLTFIGLIVPVLRTMPALAAALAAGLVALAGFDWPYSTGLFAAAVVGIAAGIAAESAHGPAPESASDAAA
jgi:predicted branched-subunit amino acid permease